jgi:hypothetical protein
MVVPPMIASWLRIGSSCLFLNGDFGTSPFLGQFSGKQLA